MRHCVGRAVRALILLSLGILLLPLMAANPVNAADLPAEISNIDSYPRYITSSTISIDVSYRCTNTPAPDGIVHWITATLQQDGKARYSMGFRNDSAVNMTRANCTGAMVTQTLTLARSGNIAETVPDPETGRSEITVQLEQRATPDRGGSLTYKGLGATRTQTVFLGCNGPYTAGRCYPPRMVPTKLNAVSRTVVYTSPTTMGTWVNYTCQNLPAPLGRVHYLIVDFQRGPQDSTVHYSVGTRGEGPTLQATCTGKPVHQFLTLTGYFFPPGKHNPKPGRGMLGVSLVPRGTQDMGGWYVSTGTGATWRGPATLVCNSRFLAPGKTLPAVCKHR